MELFMSAEKLLTLPLDKNREPEVIKLVFRSLVLIIMDHIEKNTFNWKVTSYSKNRIDSMKHSLGIALDLAPDIPEHEKRLYARYNSSDPVLNQRIKLLGGISRGISDANRDSQLFEVVHRFGMFIDVYLESDHLHIEARPIEDVKEYRRPVIFRIWLFDRPGVYPDSRYRHNAATVGALPFETLGQHLLLNK